MANSTSQLVITGIGMVSSLGLDAGGACAAARAGLAQPAELEYALFDQEARAEVKVFGHSMGLYTKGFSELGRWVRIGSLALQNLLTRCQMDAAALTRMPFYVNLPSGYYLESAKQRRPPRTAAQKTEEPEGPAFEALIPWYEAGIVDKVFAAVDAPGSPSSRKVFFEDEAGVVSTLAAARDALGSGRASMCVVGGIDSLVDPLWVPVCDDLGILKTGARPVGFMPGEGAAFLLLELEAQARRRGGPILATLGGLSMKRDPNQRFSDKPPTGEALSATILESLRQAQGACTTFYCDLNGDPVRAFDWGCAQARIRPQVAGRTDIVPAQAFGATRAASGFMAACLAARAFEKGYSKSESALVWAASDSGVKGSFTMRRGARA